MQHNIKNRTIYCKDNLDIMKGMNSESIDLIYLDPPFNKNKTFTAPIGSSAEGAEFKDIFRRDDIKDDWVKDINEDDDHEPIRKFLETIENLNSLGSKGKNNHYEYNYCYLTYMARRLIEMRRVLKESGSLYLHCDPTMSHYLKILLDIIFGEKNFRNEIVWKRVTSSQKGSQHEDKSWGANGDIILYYGKSKDTPIKAHRALQHHEILEKFPLVDEATGQRYFDDSAHIWRTPGLGPRPNLCYTWRGFTNPNPAGWRMKKDRLEEEYQKGNIVIKPDGKLQRRKYLKDYKGLRPGNLWFDINPVIGKESLGYPTQKPVALIERIIQASCPEGGIVLDPFCGCATTCSAAERLGRKWIGIDVSHKAYELVMKRLEKEVNPNLKEIRNGKEISHPEAMLNYWEKKVTYKTNAPTRTDRGEDYREKKYVYIMYYRRTPGEYKVGIAKDWRQRLNSYQTASRKRDAVMPFHLLTPNFREVERRTHEHFRADGEWVEAPLQEIIDYISGLGG